MGKTDRVTVDLTLQQIGALISAIDGELGRQGKAKYGVGIEGVTHYDERMVRIRIQERLLRNARAALVKDGGEKLDAYLKGVRVG